MKQFATIQGLQRFSSFVLRGRRQNMSKGKELGRGIEGEDFHDIKGKECVVQDMSLMVTITDLEGESLPEGCLTVPNIDRLCQEKTTHLPYEVLILNDRHTLIDFEKGIPIVDISRELYGTHSWGELEVNVGCIVSGKQSLINIFKD